MERNREEQTRQQRKERVPLGVPRRKLQVPEVPGKVRRWVNDTVGRLQQAQQGGYEFCTDQTLQVGDVDASNSTPTDSRVSRIVGVKEDGTPMRAYLMEIRQDWYDEDQTEKARKIQETESSLRRGSDKHGSVGQEGRYIPEPGIRIDSRKIKDESYG